MSREPSYPKDAAVGTDATSSEREEKPSTPSTATPEGSKRNKHLMAGAAIGIGSAAIVAALLYANRSRKN